MSKKVTYGVYGLIDWTARIPIGKARLSVQFQGGALTKYGTTPAEFTTSDPFTQRVIEDSDYYRSKKIVTLRSQGTHEQPKPSRRLQQPTLPLQQEPDSSEKEAKVGGKAAETMTMPLEDAIDYLHNRFGVNTAAMRTPAQAKETARQYGITLNISD